MTKEGSVIPAEFLKKDIVGSLPHFSVDHKGSEVSSVPDEFHSCALKIPRYVFENYYVRWTSSTHIELRDKADSRFVVIASCGRVPDEKLLEACQMIKKEELSRSRLRRNQILSADLRFKQQVIFSMKKEEG